MQKNYYGLSERSYKYFNQELKLRGYSKNTISDYLYHNDKFLKWIKKDSDEVKGQDIKDYIEYLIDKGLNERSTNMIHSALKFYYSNFMKRKFFKNISRRKNPKTIPISLPKNQILRMINSTNNPKHKLVIKLLFSSGLRVGECVKVKIEDFDLNNKLLYVKRGKGKKDRITILSQDFILDFKKYLIQNKIEKGYLFQGKNSYLFISSVEKIVNKATKKANISLTVYPHILRASFATHLNLNGTTLPIIQKLMGHSNIDTTRGYIRIPIEELMKIKSPLDY